MQEGYLEVLRHVRPGWRKEQIKTKVLNPSPNYFPTKCFATCLKKLMADVHVCRCSCLQMFIFADVHVCRCSCLQMFTDGLTNKLVGGWVEGTREDTVLVR